MNAPPSLLVPALACHFYRLIYHGFHSQEFFILIYSSQWLERVEEEKKDSKAILVEFEAKSKELLDSLAANATAFEEKVKEVNEKLNKAVYEASFAFGASLEEIAKEEKVREERTIPPLFLFSIFPALGSRKNHSL